VCLALVLIALSFGEKMKWKLALYPAAAAALSLLTFAGYGAYFGWETFVNVLKANSNRFFGASSEIFYTVISNAKITRNYTDGWITASIFAFFITAFRGWAKDKNIRFMVIAFFSYLFIFLFFGSESYGFYRFPFYPFFIISFAYPQNRGSCRIPAVCAVFQSRRFGFSPGLCFFFHPKQKDLAFDSESVYAIDIRTDGLLGSARNLFREHRQMVLGNITSIRKGTGA
ncbi:MAG: hypothetical protein UX13_C0021G0001, partial [Candidatus Woesebacteria bacterium GW2011_GWB1_45_5]